MYTLCHEAGLLRDRVVVNFRYNQSVHLLSIHISITHLVNSGTSNIQGTIGGPKTCDH